MERAFFRIILTQLRLFVSDTQKPKWLRTLVLFLLYAVYVGFIIWFAGYIYSERQFMDGGLTFLVILIFIGLFFILFNVTKRYIQANKQSVTSEETDMLINEIDETTDINE